MLKIIRRLLLCCFFIYGFNIMGQKINIILPINIFTISYTSIFGLFGFISLIIIYLFAF